ncbi:hypothetical protein BDR26DRAFT_864688 [Obelidium mucronatum]|nr:hypothetical protein BDR26DRAFT_864688 [Obelidium mucronatum]
MQLALVALALPAVVRAGLDRQRGAIACCCRCFRCRPVVLTAVPEPSSLTIEVKLPSSAISSQGLESLAKRFTETFSSSLSTTAFSLAFFILILDDVGWMSSLG